MNDAGAAPPHDPLAAAALELAQSHRAIRKPPRAVPARGHLPGMVAWSKRLARACASAEPEASKAAEWLLDNHYRIRRTIRQVHDDLPADFYRRLPSLAGPELKGLPRIFHLAREFLRVSHLQLTLTGLVQFVRAYQDSAPLAIAELWAFPTMLRLVCLELLVEASDRLFSDLKPPFEERICLCISENYDPTECIARALSGLRVISSISWKDFFDRTSHVESLLRLDPAEIYARMDFDTRDRYRKAVEELAEGSRSPEHDVAEWVLHEAHDAPDDDRRSHVGYWLVDEGRRAIEARLEYRPTRGAAVRRWLLRHAGPAYASALAVAALAALLVPAFYLTAAGAAPAILIGGVALSFVPASIIAITIVHWIVPLVVPPRVLPKLDFEKGIPPDCRTAVVVPVIVGRPEEAAALTTRLEMHWLANPDPHVRFALLSDPKDASEEHSPEDAAVETALAAGIRALNARYGRNGEGPFHLMHRARHFNASEGRWMAWERKRGKLEQFDRFALGLEEDAFPVREGDAAALRHVRFVVTVDADTVLPAGAVARLVGTLAHPLNRAEFEPVTGRLRAGYTVIQPRVEISPEAGDRSLFQRFYAGDTAIDIYSRAVSDVYQDLFGSAIYVGKGIYELEPFHRSLDGRVPENTLLSHDLFEGAHGRAALASDIVLYDGFPTGYIEYAHRWHRWVRGDWQLVPWLGHRVPATGGRKIENRLSALDRWKIFDNLRRSAIPLALVTLAVGGWLALPGSPWIWTLLTVAAPAFYLLTDAITGLARGRRRGVLLSTYHQLTERLGRWLLAVAFLLQDSLVSLDAIGRTLWRMFVSRRRLLSWTSAAHTAARLSGMGPRRLAWQSMWPAPAASALFALVLAQTNPTALLPAIPLLLLWFASPEIAAWISRPRIPTAEKLNAEDRVFLRRVARRTWLFFETFVGPEDNWLPPDNYQEDPRTEIAHRTSPTNVGMYLLSVLTAWDFGYVGSADLAVRVENCLDTFRRLERYRGHFLNWYDTRSLAPLEPRYVSTVDSGNLAVSLLTLKEGCRAAADAPVLRACQWDAFGDLLALLASALERLPGGAPEELAQHMQTLTERLAAVRDRPAEWHGMLAELTSRSWPELTDAIAAAAAAPAAPRTDMLYEIQVWLERANHDLTRMRWSFEAFFPWLALVEAPPRGCEDVARRIAELLGPSMPPAAAGKNCRQATDLLANFVESSSAHDAAVAWSTTLLSAIAQGGQAQRELRERLLDDAARLAVAAFAMDFALLYDRDSKLFHIGYNVSADRLDPHFYDLLATEARLASYFAIAKRDVPVEHWYFLGRPITRIAGEHSLLSWNGSMFEYLMPSLLLRSSPGTLLERSERTAVDFQRRHARALDMPWGVSESAFAERDSGHNYQYRAFGVPGLGLKRGLARDRVIAPYASALALAVRPVSAARNLEEMAALGLMDLYGFLEAVDFTPERVPSGSSFVPVRAYMAHHQGMILAAVGNALHDDILVTRFSEDLRMRTMVLLLQERVPSELPPEFADGEEPARAEIPLRAKSIPYPWRPQSADLFPQIHMLGNGRFSSWISESGGGALWWHRQSLTRCSQDSTRADQGMWVYICDGDTQELWSVGRQPTGIVPEDTQVVFHAHMAEFHCRHNGIATRMEVGVSPGDDIEIRRVTIVNETGRTRRLRITSYAEVVLAAAREDERHLAFSKLFVGSERIASLDALLFTRRPRGPAEHPPVLLHRVVFDDREPVARRYETDRGAFLGRNAGPQRPRGAVGELSETAGWTLDPAMALQFDIELEAQEACQFAFATIAAGSRESALEIAERYATLASLDWALNDAAHELARDAHELGLEPERFPELQSLASLLLAPQATLRAPAAQIAANRLGQPRLWSLGLSGDLPILLLRLGDPQAADLMRVLVRAHKLWRSRQFFVDLVLVRTGASGYEEPVRERLLSAIRDAGHHDMLGRNGGIHLIFADQIGPDDRRLLEVSANVVLDDSLGSLARQLASVFEVHPVPPRFEPTRAVEIFSMPPLPRAQNLQFDNGVGGISEDGKEYVIHLEPGERTPAPWCNVLANDAFGCLVSESGSGFTWAANSGEHRLTPWTNDPITDAPGEVLYLRDEESAEIWSPTPAPAGRDTASQIRHGAGYTSWLKHSNGFRQELTIFVAPGDPVKIVRLRLHNATPHTRRVTATYYAEWLLGALRSASRLHIVSRYDADSHALFAHSDWNPEFASRVAFLASSRPAHSVTTDRRDFLGREGDLRKPSGLLHWDLGGRVAPAGEPCAAFQVHLDIAAEETAEVVFILGEGKDAGHARELLARWRDPAFVAQAFDDLRAHWDRQLGTVQVQTPDPAFDPMVNRWLLYQTLASRILARAGFYQAGGAIGFRDQLQDVLAVVHGDPARARAHILACAARQFEQGDVLHWWHPPQGRGVRTRCSDDLLWLPYVTSLFVEATGDVAILDEQIPFLHGPELAAEESDRFALFEATQETHSLFEHCRRAIERGMTRGPHGLPLIGAGDWNDGMNHVGARGRGESVWLAWFAIATLNGFIDIAARANRAELAENWSARAEELRNAVEQAAWDGEWYVRAFDDDGHAWGSANNDECRIDSIAQSWAVLSGAAAPDRARAAVGAAERELVREEQRLIRLLWPPFHETRRDPGYIKAYPPGIRENGGQYSHAAAWRGLALAKLGDGDGAWRVFDLLNPLRRTQSRRDVERYRAEPYVLAADIASVAPHIGRGGWTWYTGAAAWTWRLAVEGILGLRLDGGDLLVDPCLPKNWGSAHARFKGPSGELAISIEDPDHLGRGVAELTVDGMPAKGARVAFPTDGSVRDVRVRLTRSHSG